MNSNIRSIMFINGVLNLLSAILFLAVFGFVSSTQAARYYILLDSKKPVLQNKLLSLQNTKYLKNLDATIIDIDDSKIESVQFLESLKSNSNAQVIKERFFKYPKLSKTKFSNQFLSSKLIQPGLPWGIAAIHAPEVWKMGEKGTHSKVVILDSGIDKDHEAIKNNFYKGKNFISEKNRGPYEYYDNDGHGTHVAGTIAGRELASGFAGVAPQAFIMSGRVCGEEVCSSIAIVEGIDWAIAEKADVVNLSLGGKEITIEEADVVTRAVKNNVVIVAASGNDGSNEIEYPAKLPEVISVGAVDQKLERASFSQYGPELTIAAPGVGVVSSVPTNTAVDLQLQANTDHGTVLLNGSVITGSGFVAELSQEVVLSGLGYRHELKSYVKGKIALIKRGELSFAEKVDNAIDAGAAGVIIFNNTDEDDNGGMISYGSQVSIPAVMISKREGELLASSMKKKAVHVDLKMTKASFDSYDGTSMATPHVVGVVALLRSLNKKLTVEQIKKIITTTASPSTSILNECGSGIINAETAIMESLKY